MNGSNLAVFEPFYFVLSVWSIRHKIRFFTFKMFNNAKFRDFSQLIKNIKKDISNYEHDFKKLKNVTFYKQFTLKIVIIFKLYQDYILVLLDITFKKWSQPFFLFLDFFNYFFFKESNLDSILFCQSWSFLKIAFVSPKKYQNLKMYFFASNKK